MSRVLDLSPQIIATTNNNAGPSTPVPGPQLAGNRPAGNAGAAVADSGELRLTVTPNHAQIFVDEIQVGSGRKFFKTKIGTHVVRFSALECNPKTEPLLVKKNEPTVYNAVLTCR